MRKLTTPRDSRSAQIFDFETSRRDRAVELEELASFAPRTPGVRPLPRHFESDDSAPGEMTAPVDHPARDLAALQLIEAAETAYHLARSSEKVGPCGLRAFDILGVVNDALADAGPRARALGVQLLQAPAPIEAPPSVIGESHRLRQILAKLVASALETRAIATLSLTHRTWRQDQRLVFDIRLRLQRRHGAVSHLEIYDGPEDGETDRHVSLIVPPDLLAAAVGADRDPESGEADLSIGLRFRLPLAASQPQSPHATDLTEPNPTDDEAALSGLRLLLVEDIDLNRKMVGLLLSPFGCELSEAVDGLEALNAVEANPYDVILMDLTLPEIDGFEAIRRIRARNDERATIPILAVSGRVMTADIAQARAAGADAHLSKPFTSQELVTAIVKCRREASRATR